MSWRILEKGNCKPDRENIYVNVSLMQKENLRARSTGGVLRSGAPIAVAGTAEDLTLGNY